MRLLIRVMVVFVAVLAALSIFRNALAPRPTGGPEGAQRKSGAAKLVKDPVCGMYIAPASSLKASRNSETFYFCSEACRAKFLAS